MLHEFTDANFETEVLKSAEPVLVDFWAPWCGPCKILGPVIEELASVSETTSGAKVGKLNVDENPRTAEKYGIMSIPTVMAFKGGQVADQMVGVQSKVRLLKAIEKAR